MLPSSLTPTPSWHPARPMLSSCNRRGARFLRALLITAVMVAAVQPITAGEAELNRVSLPPTVQLDALTDLVAQSLGISVHFGEGKVTGVVRVSLAAPVGGKDLWSIYHQLLNNAGLTTVLSGGAPPVYHVVQMAEATQAGQAFPAEDLAKITYQPGYQVLVYNLDHTSAEALLKILSTILTGPGIQLRSMGGDGRQLMISAPAAKQQEAKELIRLVDQPGRQSAVRQFKPELTTPTVLQASAVAAWTALGRIEDNPRAAEILLAPDGVRLLLVAASADLDRLERMVRDLDQSEPIITRTYRPQVFSLDEVSNLIMQAVGDQSPTMATVSPASAPTATATKLQIIRDHLTGSLLIKATSAQHERIASLLKTIESTPPGSRRQTRSIQIKHRRADEISRLVLAMISADSVGAANNPGNATSSSGGQTSQPNPQLGASSGMPQSQPGSLAAPFGGGAYQPGMGSNPFGMSGGYQGAPTLPTAPAMAQASVARSADGSLLMTADPVTNRLIVLGEPRIIDQVEQLVKQLDEYQPQVDLEFILVGLTDDQTKDLGIELVGQFSNDGTSATIASLFGLSSSTAGDATVRTLGNAAGLGTVVLKPGDFAAVLRALETVNNGRSVIKSQLIVANNAQATLNGVIQQPISSINSSTQVATTSYAGTSDAGTQITVSPQISPADYVTLSYSLSQSSFLGQPIITDTGVIPPTKRNDNVSSIATVPDGHVIALGGLSNQVDGQSESRIPLLGSVPFFGRLFSSTKDSRSTSRLFAFIRVTILRRANFSDLRYLSGRQLSASGVSDDEPVLKGKFIR